MAAIDLLFDVKRDSERLHQLVLGALLQRTTLLSRLVPQPEEPRQLQLHWEPDGKAYDLGVSYVQASQASQAQADGRRRRVLIELKLDGALGEDQLAQQLNPGRLHADDRLLYLLLGFSAITTDRAALRERARRIGEHTGRPELLDRISVRDADDLIPLLADPSLLPGGPDHRDARDLASSYRDALLALAERGRRFATRPVADWQDGDYFGFFAAARARGIAGLARARIGRVQSPDGTVAGCDFGEVPLSAGTGDGHLDLHFENGRLCLRLHVASERKALRQRALDILEAAGWLEPGHAQLGPLTAAPLRLSAAMTVAQRDGLLAGFPGHFDWEQLRAQLEAAEAIARKVAADLRPQSKIGQK